MIEDIRLHFRQLNCAADFWSLRVVDERADCYSVRKNVPQPPSLSIDRGAMLTVYAGGGSGYAATSDLSRDGLQHALDRAAGWARASAQRSPIDFRTLAARAPRGEYASPDADSTRWSRRDWYELLSDESRSAGCDSRI